MIVSLITLKKRLPAWVGSLVLLLPFAIPHEARAAVIITADLADVADIVPGQDLWNASFALSNGTFQMNQGFTVFFDPALYRDLSAPLAPLPPGWDVLTIQPNVLLSAPGFVDGLALENNPTLLEPFSLNFTWLGPGLPGSQPFEIYSQAGTFQIMQTGETVIPEPGTVSLLTGVFIFHSMYARRGRRRSSPPV